MIKSKIVTMRQNDIDTDLIIPAEYLTTTSREGLGRHLFARVRDDFDFESEAEILVAGENFGCGSSREHAAWALKDWGIKAIIAPSFADIFHSNALKNGIVLVVLPAEICAKISGEVEVDLEQQLVRFGGQKYSFEIDPYRKECLLKGMDDMDYLLSRIDKIKSFKSKIFFDTSKL